MPRKNREDYNKYMREYMKKYRQWERELIKKAKRNYNIPLNRRAKKTTQKQPWKLPQPWRSPKPQKTRKPQKRKRKRK